MWWAMLRGAAATFVERVVKHSDAEKSARNWSLLLEVVERS
jgi:hypothetical protein